MRLAFDIESDGFLDNVSRIHCIVIQDIDTKKVYKFHTQDGPHSPNVADGIRMLTEADMIIGHNIILYDLPVIIKLYSWASFEKSKIRDTLTLSRLVYSNLSDRDAGSKALGESKLIGSHSLEAWGIRMGYPKVQHEDWTTFSPEMLERCVVDTEITVRLWKLLETEQIDPRASELEHSVQFIVAEQERHGVVFDQKAALDLNTELSKLRVVLEQELQDVFPPWYAKTEEVVPKKTIEGKKKPGTWAGAPYTKIKLVSFNPSSRFHIANRLTYKYGWKPDSYNDDGSAKVDETVLEKLVYPEAKLLAKYMLVQKRLSMLSEGESAWLKLVQPDGRIHGQLITNGAVTGRATHRSPNLSQVPANSSPYGEQCRALFTVPEDFVQIGADCSGLELRMLAHYLAYYDGGAYAKVVTEGDVHTANQIAAGLETRTTAKTFIYAFLYGAGDQKIGSIVDPKASESKQRKIGKELKAKFVTKTPGLEQLISKVQKAAERKYLVGLDGRKLHVRSSHSALNTLLQSAGALVCKRWMVEVDNRMGDFWAYQQILWSHDELQFEYWGMNPKGFGENVVQCITHAQHYFEIKCPLTGEYKIGRNWAECH